jgi:two-component system chemotaxis response regulator CheB
MANDPPGTQTMFGLGGAQEAAGFIARKPVYRPAHGTSDWGTTNLMAFRPNGHDIVVIGASAGGVEALVRVVAGLPRDFGAAVFVVLHMPADVPSALASILSRSGALRADIARDGEPIMSGRIYVPEPNRHLVLQPGRVRLTAGPRENSARPSVDMLFRSAARTYGRRVVGVVLSGTLRDGALGLATIKQRNGVTMVQDPAEALFAGMPESALSTSHVDYCLPVATIPKQLIELTHKTTEPSTMHPAESNPASEVTTHAADEPLHRSSPKKPNAASGLTCPECHGSLWEIEDSGGLRFECRIGHAYGVDALIADQGQAVEAALWSAINVLQERSATFRRLAGLASVQGMGPRYQQRAEQVEQHANTLLNLLRRLIIDGEVG